MKIPSVSLTIYTAIIIFSKYVNFNPTRLLLELLKFIFNIDRYKLLLMELKIIFINFDVHCVLQTITTKLKHLNEEVHYEPVSASTCRSVCQRVSDLTKGYVSICGLVKQLNASHSAVLFIIFSANTLLLMFSFINLIDVFIVFTGETHQRINIILQLIWCAKFLVTILLFIEPWHQIQAEVTEIQIVLTKLIHNLTPAGKSIPLKLDLMFKQLLLNQPSISPLGMFTVQRILFIKTISFVTTYSLLLIQFTKNRWKKYAHSH
ncbi:uncharacterized protein LOC124532793 [Vanessa cardui]|uniref:uncharacterized protein LOC124532793 n=1 Tax=Vanessa cardui TaxID=171605 RepID=UPI001F146AB8|nr:uncharacterized protein LOC124532793 [Vanessa cardui]